AAGDSVRKNAIQPDASEQQRKQTKEPGERGYQPLAQDGRIDQRFEPQETDRDCRIDLTQDALDRRNGFALGEPRSDEKRKAGSGALILRGGVVGDRKKLFAQVFILGVSNQADDLVGCVRVAGRRLDPEPSTNRIFSTGKLAREGLVYNRHLRRTNPVARFEISAGKQRDLKRPEVIGADAAQARIPGLPRVLAVHPRVAPSPVAKRYLMHDRSRFYSRDRSHAVEQFIFE